MNEYRAVSFVFKQAVEHEIAEQDIEQEFLP